MNMLWAFNFTDNGHFSKKKLPPSDFSNYCKVRSFGMLLIVIFC